MWINCKYLEIITWTSRPQSNHSINTVWLVIHTTHILASTQHNTPVHHVAGVTLATGQCYTQVTLSNKARHMTYMAKVASQLQSARIPCIVGFHATSSTKPLCCTEVSTFPPSPPHTLQGRVGAGVQRKRNIPHSNFYHILCREIYGN